MLLDVDKKKLRLNILSSSMIYDPRVRRPARAATLHNQLRYLQLQLIVTHEQIRMHDAGNYIYSILHKAMLHAIAADYNYLLLKLATYKR